MLIELSLKELDFIRQALRNSEETHTRNGFKALAELSVEIRNKISDTLIDNHAVLGQYYLCNQVNNLL